jgi:hypothetical protein
MKFSLLVVTMLFVTSVLSQTFNYDYEIPCAPTKDILSLLTEFEEEMTWAGKHIDDESMYSLWVHPMTGAWTLLKMTPSVSCVLGIGMESKSNYLHKKVM